MRASRRRLLTAGTVVAGIALLVGVVYQDPITQWGSTHAERAAAMAGDDVVANANSVWTRSITIHAPPEEIWPWIVQMGVGRGGFYSYDWGEQLLFDPVHNATTVHPEWQSLAAGDVIHPMPGSDWRVVVLDEDRALVLDNPQVTPTDWTWSTELRPLDHNRTRLVTRVRSHKGSFFSYALDVPDLILFPRLLTGIKQRAEGTLPGMSGTHTGQPFPMARLPVHPWAAAAWIAGLAALGLILRRTAGFGRWGRRRPHPWVTASVAFVAGAGYMIMSDTPPVHFFTHTWLLGLLLAAAAGVYLGRRVRELERTDEPRQRWLPRAIAAVTETGMFVVLPLTAVWQAATKHGWTVWAFPDHIIIGVAALLVAVAVARVAWGTDERSCRPLIAAVLAGGYALTGSSIVPLLGAAIIEAVARPKAAAPIIELSPDGTSTVPTGDNPQLDAAVQRFFQPDFQPARTGVSITIAEGENSE